MKYSCSFLWYRPNKPKKFRIKYWVFTEVKSKYCLNESPYCSKVEDCPSNQALRKYIVTIMTDTYKNSGINETCNNYFYIHPASRKFEKMENFSSRDNQKKTGVTHEYCYPFHASVQKYLRPYSPAVSGKTE